MSCYRLTCQCQAALSIAARPRWKICTRTLLSSSMRTWSAWNTAGLRSSKGPSTTSFPWWSRAILTRTNTITTILKNSLATSIQLSAITGPTRQTSQLKTAELSVSITLTYSILLSLITFQEIKIQKNISACFISDQIYHKF